MKENKALAKKLNIVAYILSAVVLLLVGMMRRVKLDIGLDLSFLPMVNALLNTVVAILLVVALYYIKKKDIINHRKAIIAANGFFCVVSNRICILSFYHRRDPVL